MVKQSNRGKAMSEEVELRVEIDPLRLEWEWTHHSEQVSHFAREEADAQFKYDQAAAKLDVRKAEIDLEVRESPADFGLSKLTETTVAAAVGSHPDVKIGVKRVIDARHERDIARAALRALEHRKRALSMLVELWVREYYASPNETTLPANDRDARTFGREKLRRGEMDRREDEDDD